MTLLKSFQEEQDNVTADFVGELSYAFAPHVEIPYWYERIKGYIHSREEVLLKRIVEEIEKMRKRTTLVDVGLSDPVRSGGNEDYNRALDDIKNILQ